MKLILLLSLVLISVECKYYYGNKTLFYDNYAHPMGTAFMKVDGAKKSVYLSSYTHHIRVPIHRDFEVQGGESMERLGCVSGNSKQNTQILGFPAFIEKMETLQTVLIQYSVGKVNYKLPTGELEKFVPADTSTQFDNFYLGYACERSENGVSIVSAPLFKHMEGRLYGKLDSSKQFDVIDWNSRLQDLTGIDVAAIKGYSNDLWAIGAARGGETMGGQVYIARIDKKLNADYVQTLSEGPIGSCFGWSLAVIDITKDGHDELFVGAPFMVVEEFYSAGAVFVYYSRTVDVNFQLWKKITAPSPGNGRHFSFVLKNVGDLDGDDIPEVGMNELHKSNANIYIFSGYEISLISTTSLKPKQILSSEQLDYFGIRFVGDVDQDDNKSPDLLVIANSTSNNGFIYLSPNQIQVKITSSLNPQYLNASFCEELYTCLDITYTFQIEAQVFLNLDKLVFQPKLVMQNNENGKISGNSDDNITFERNGVMSATKTFKVKILREKVNAYTSHIIVLHNEINEIKSSSDANSLHYVIYDHTTSLTTKPNCTQQYQCEVDLDVKIVYEPFIEIKSNPTISFSIVISSLKDVAYYTTITIGSTTDFLMPYDKLENRYKCSQESSLDFPYKCAVRDLYYNDKVELSNFEMKYNGKIRLGLRRLPLTIDFSITSRDSGSQTMSSVFQLKKSATFQLRYNTRFHTKFQMASKMLYIPTTIQEDDNIIGPQILHDIVLLKTGVGELPNIEVEFYLPIVNQDRNLLISDAQLIGGLKDKCEMNYTIGNSLDYKVSLSDYSCHNFPSHCTLVRCSIQNSDFKLNQATISFKGYLLYKPLLMSNILKGDLVFSYKFSLNYKDMYIMDKYLPMEDSYIEKSLTTPFLPHTVEPVDIPYWLIIIAIIIGLLLVLLLALVLWKFGFFRRKSPEDFIKEDELADEDVATAKFTMEDKVGLSAL